MIIIIIIIITYMKSLYNIIWMLKIFTFLYDKSLEKFLNDTYSDRFSMIAYAVTITTIHHRLNDN